MKQSRRTFLKTAGRTGAALGLMGLGGCSRWSFGPAASSPTKPNVIVILADDLGWGDLGCYGQQKIQTPHLDQMAAEGIRFVQHYAGSTVCAPSRCTLLTGQHTGHCTVRGNEDIRLRPDDNSIARVMKQAGYATACIGKWGIGHPSPPEEPHEMGFDHFFGYLSMWHAHNAWPDFLYKNKQRVELENVVDHPATHYKKGQESCVGLARVKKQYASDLFTEDALTWIEQHRHEPFFLFMPYTIPHANNEAAQYGVHGMEVPNLGPYQDKNWPEVEKAKAAAITLLDDYVGRFLAKLKELNLDQNTLVIFTSDNGPHNEGQVNHEFFDSNGPLTGHKRDLYEGGIRVPLIARWPGVIAPGRVSDHPSAFYDLLPTLAEIAGVRAPDHVDGISFLPTLRGGHQKRHTFLYWEFHEGSSKQAVLLEGRWKAIRNRPSQPIELYDLHTDIGEQHNIADRHPDIVAQVRSILANVRTNPQRWPLKDSKPKVPH